MPRLLIWLGAIAALVFILMLFRTSTDTKLNVTPEAREAIEKAKRR